MHNTERDDVARKLVLPEGELGERWLESLKGLNMVIEQRHEGIPIVCEVLKSSAVGSSHELVVVVPGKENSYTLHALRPLREGEKLVLRRRDNHEEVHGMLYYSRDTQREGDPKNLHIAGLKVTQGIL